VVSAEGKGLDWVLEVHVGGDRKKDAERNVARYARLGIPEYCGRMRFDGDRVVTVTQHHDVIPAIHIRLVRLSTGVQVDAVCRPGFHPDPGPVLLPERSEPRPCTTCERAIVEVATQVTCHRSLRTVRLAFLRHDLLASRSNDRVGHHVCHPAADAGEVAPAGDGRIRRARIEAGDVSRGDALVSIEVEQVRAIVLVPLA
jgi:hypothetical protein